MTNPSSPLLDKTKFVSYDGITTTLAEEARADQARGNSLALQKEFVDHDLFLKGSADTRRCIETQLKKARREFDRALRKSVRPSLRAPQESDAGLVAPSLLIFAADLLLLALFVLAEFILAKTLLTHYQVDVEFFPNADLVVAGAVALLFPLLFEPLFAGDNARARTIRTWTLVAGAATLVVALSVFRFHADKTNLGIEIENTSEPTLLAEETSQNIDEQEASEDSSAVMAAGKKILNSPWALFSYILLSLMTPLASASLATRIGKKVGIYGRILLYKTGRIETDDWTAEAARLEARTLELEKRLEQFEEKVREARARRQMLLYLRERGAAQTPVPARRGQLNGVAPLLLAGAVVLLGATGCGTPEKEALETPKNALYLFDASASIVEADSLRAETIKSWLSEDATPGATVRFGLIHGSTSEFLPATQPFCAPDSPPKHHNHYVNRANEIRHAKSLARSRDSASSALSEALRQPVRSQHTDIWGTLVLPRQFGAKTLRIWSDMRHDAPGRNAASFRFADAAEAARQGAADAENCMKAVGQPRPLTGVDVCAVVPVPLQRALARGAGDGTYTEPYWRAFFETAGARSVAIETRSVIHP